MNPIYIHRTDGNYLGFISNNNLFSRDGIYLGWIENDTVWDKSGRYRGQVTPLNGGNYILKHRFMISPIPRVAKVAPISPIPPIPPANRPAIIVPIPYEDGFKGSSNL